MPDGNHERRISTVEANIQDFRNSVNSIERYLEKLFNQTGDIKVTLALVVQNQTASQDYQEKCEDERKDHEKRLTACEGFQGRLTKMAIAVTGVGSLLSPQLSKIWERLFS